MGALFTSCVCVSRYGECGVFLLLFSRKEYLMKIGVAVLREKNKNSHVYDSYSQNQLLNGKKGQPLAPSRPTNFDERLEQLFQPRHWFR